MAGVFTKIFGLPLLLLIVLTSLLLYTYQSVRSLDIAQTTQVQENLHEVFESVALDAMTSRIERTDRRQSIITIDTSDVEEDIREQMKNYIRDNNILISTSESNFSKDTSEECINTLIDKLQFKDSKGNSVSSGKITCLPKDGTKGPSVELPSTPIYYKTITTKAYSGSNVTSHQSEIHFKVQIEQLLGAQYMDNDANKDQRDTHTIIRQDVSSIHMGNIPTGNTTPNNTDESINNYYKKNDGNINTLDNTEISTSDFKYDIE